MRASIVILMLVFVPLLFVVGCGEAAAPGEEGLTASEGAVPEESATETATGAGTPTDSVTIANSAGEAVVVPVEIADEPAEQQRGLMDRDELAEDAGMLFVFEREQPRSFWMRNTRIPLSIAYIDAGGRIVDVKDMEPFDETSVPSAGPAQYALEVNQGFFADRGIEVGDTLELPER